MTDSPELQTGEGSDTTMYRPSAEGGLEAAPAESSDYRDGLQASRWNAAPLENPEVEKTDGRIAVAAIVMLSAITLIILVLGYGSGFWG